MRHLCIVIYSNQGELRLSLLEGTFIHKKCRKTYVYPYQAQFIHVVCRHTCVYRLRVHFFLLNS